MVSRFYVYLILMLVFSCQTKKENSNRAVATNAYAHGFEINVDGEVTRLTVKNPWEEAQDIAIDYYLLNRGASVPDSLQGKNILFCPVKRVVCLSTSHIAFIDAIGETDKIVGVSGGDYVTNSYVANKINKGEIVDVGYGQNLNYELLVKQKPDLVMVYGIGSEVSALVRKLGDLGVPAIMNAEYLEENPLGKAEWIKFVGSLFKKEAEAEKFFKDIEADYIRLKEMVKGKGQAPKVLVGSPYKDSWWVPGGNSYMANLIADAGGDYLGKNNTSHESYVISFENAFGWAASADVWINMSSLGSKKEIMDFDSRFQNLKVLDGGRVFNNINKMTKKGGNDFWESGAIYPNLILQDLIKVFYPTLLQEEEFAYYAEIK